MTEYQKTKQNNQTKELLIKILLLLKNTIDSKIKCLRQKVFASLVIMIGDTVCTPVQSKMNTANLRPCSNNPEFIKNWTDDLPKRFPDYLGIADAWEKKEKYKPQY